MERHNGGKLFQQVTFPCNEKTLSSLLPENIRQCTGRMSAFMFPAGLPGQGVRGKGGADVK